MIWAVGRKLGPEITDVLAICGRKLRPGRDARQVHVRRQVGTGTVHNLVWKAGETIDEADWAFEARVCRHGTYVSEVFAV